MPDVYKRQAKGSNSGILYLAQEITSKDKDGNDAVSYTHLDVYKRQSSS